MPSTLSALKDPVHKCHSQSNGVVLNESNVETVSTVVLDVGALEQLDRLFVQSSLFRDGEEQTVLQAIDQERHSGLVAERTLG